MSEANRPLRSKNNIDERENSGHIGGAMWVVTTDFGSDNLKSLHLVALHRSLLQFLV